MGVIGTEDHSNSMLQKKAIKTTEDSTGLKRERDRERETKGKHDNE